MPQPASHCIRSDLVWLLLSGEVDESLRLDCKTCSDTLEVESWLLLEGEATTFLGIGDLASLLDPLRDWLSLQSATTFKSLSDSIWAMMAGAPVHAQVAEIRSLQSQTTRMIIPGNPFLTFYLVGPHPQLGHLKLVPEIDLVSTCTNQLPSLSDHLPLNLFPLSTSLLQNAGFFLSCGVGVLHDIVHVAEAWIAALDAKTAASTAATVFKKVSKDAEAKLQEAMRRPVVRLCCLHNSFHNLRGNRKSRRRRRRSRQKQISRISSTRRRSRGRRRRRSSGSSSSSSSSSEVAVAVAVAVVVVAAIVVEVVAVVVVVVVAAIITTKEVAVVEVVKSS